VRLSVPPRPHRRAAPGPLLRALPDLQPGHRGGPPNGAHCPAQSSAARPPAEL